MNNLVPMEHKSQRVLTTQQLAEIFETDTNNIINNFARHKDRFKEDRDYYFLQGPELQSFKRFLINSDEPSIKFAPSLYIWTERGANRHSKILDTDRAWEQFDILEETYFRVKTGAYEQQHIRLDFKQLIQLGRLLSRTAKYKLPMIVSLFKSQGYEIDINNSVKAIQEEDKELALVKVFAETALNNFPVSGQEVYQKFSDYCKNNCSKCISPKQFVGKMRDIGFKQRSTRAHRYVWVR